MTGAGIMLRRSKAYLTVNGTGRQESRLFRAGLASGSSPDLEMIMKNFVIAAVAAVSLGMTGAAMAATVVPPAATTVHAEQARNSVVLPSQRPTYLARNSVVLPSQRPTYLARNSVVLPSQRPTYLAGNSVVLPSQRPAYLA